MVNTRQWLSDLISDDPDKIELIRTHMDEARRSVPRWEKRLPGQDVEPSLMQGFYLACYTWDRNRKVPFGCWWKLKTFGALSKHFRVHKCKQIALSPDHIDTHYCYRMNMEELQ